MIARHLPRCMLGLLLAVTTARSSTVLAGATTCPETAIGTVAADEAGLRVVDATANALRRDDVLVQLNGRRLRSCADFAAALTEARQNEVAPLFLVRRGSETVAVAVDWP